MRTLFLISQIFYVILCDVRHILDLTFPYDSGIIDLMRKNLCDISHTDMSDLPHCLFDSGITKGAKNIMNFLGITKGAKKIMKFPGITKGIKKIMNFWEN